MQGVGERGYKGWVRVQGVGEGTRGEKVGGGERMG